MEAVLEQVDYDQMLSDVLSSVLEKTSDLKRATKIAIKRIKANDELNTACLHNLVSEGVYALLRRKRSSENKKIKVEASKTQEQKDEEIARMQKLLDTVSDIHYRCILDMHMGRFGKLLRELTGAEVREELDHVRATTKGLQKQEKLLLAVSNLVSDTAVVGETISDKKANTIAQRIF
jgi:hypothetical protein